MRLLLVSALCLGAFSSAMAQNVSLSVGINRPGVYGQINIGTLPPPALVAAQPVYVSPVPVGVAPAYLYVPVVQQRNWRHYCRRYNACGRPVYFVREDWVRDRYAHEHADRYHHDERGGRHFDRGHEGDRRGGDYRGGDHRD